MMKIINEIGNEIGKVVINDNNIQMKNIIDGI